MSFAIVYSVIGAIYFFANIFLIAKLQNFYKQVNAEKALQKESKIAELSALIKEVEVAEKADLKRAVETITTMANAIRHGGDFDAKLVEDIIGSYGNSMQSSSRLTHIYYMEQMNLKYSDVTYSFEYKMTRELDEALDFLFLITYGLLWPISIFTFEKRLKLYLKNTNNKAYLAFQNKFDKSYVAASNFVTNFSPVKAGLSKLKEFVNGLV